jgi:hypothetical protein
VPVAHTCNSNYPGGRDQYDHGLKPDWVQKVRPYLKNTQCRKGSGRMAQVIECLSSRRP